MKKRTFVVALTTAFTVMMVGEAMAGKPAGKIDWSNGFPSGPHFNLNIHGKKDGYNCDPSPGGGSVFVPEYGYSEIDFVQNIRSSVSELLVHDPCAFDDDPALVQLPDGVYQVYARILAKPQKEGEPREVVFYPKLVETCDDTGSDDFADAVDCADSFLMGTGVVTSGGMFDLESQEFVREKGKSKAVNVTELFQWTGYACDQSLDTNGDGEITLDDITDQDGDGDVDADDLALYLDTNCEYFENAWIFDIADLVVYGWDYMNNGSKLVQTRFYPVDTTTFAE
jgi:hypothetical protein